jgi:DNA-binding NarL/FixJ family response regulator
MVTRRLRVLMAEKRLSEVGLILRSICAEGGWTLEMIFVETREEVGAALRAHRPDLALLDLSLLQPAAALYVHVLHLENSQVPLIIFAEPGDEAFVEECLAHGARDYLLEGFMDERTVARVLQGVANGMEEGTLVPSPECSKAGENCRCSMQRRHQKGQRVNPSGGRTRRYRESWSEC